MRRQTLLLLFIALATPIGPEVRASQLDEKMNELAERVLAITKNQKVKVGVFSPTGLPGTNFGPGCTQSLQQALNKRQPGSVADDANFEVTGNYLFVKSRSHADLARVVKIDVRIVDLEYGEEVTKLPFRVEIDHTKAIAKVIQESVHLPPDGSKAERNRILANSVTSPSVSVRGPHQSIVSSTSDSSSAVEVLVSSNPSRPATPRSALIQSGRAFVDIAKNEIYELRLYNNGPREIAASVSIDGIDMYHFSQDRNPDGSPAFSHVVIPPRSTATVVGWHHSLEGTENYKAFLVTSYGKGAASQTGIPATEKIGVIHVQFSYSNVIPMGSRSSPGKETGFGPPRRVQQKPLRREIDPPHDFVSIRYAR
ncbi:hypothetical protein Mal15_54270 [Stieleria maiorica]|uniref:Uncharacterized protein n=1 Tax=Stieleria maiorica TaxID=2795974 RepID=A0A5B9MMS8_9BACT|nr:hypothetical protein [Stieleria maiorica]QEG01351.1 hypothetical protein Mal15_54270 [Stieleria maiorica]